jgi:ABC-type transport system involved in multi-copper enzyme maturation permease subunit
MIASTPARNPFRRLGDSLLRVGIGIVAVGTKELRGRMRGRRAFAILTLYLVLLAIFSWGIYEYQRDTVSASQNGFSGFGVAPVAISAQIGQALFTGLLLVETILVAVLAPAFTTGAISLEREKQTLDLLVTTPISSLGLVIGKLGSALAYVLMLIFASLPMAAVVFLFGGVGPDDLLRAYVLLVCFAVGFGAIGLFISALVKRTQVATVLTYLTIVALTAGTWVVWYFLYATSGVSAPGGLIPGTGAASGRPAQQMLWLNPFVADMDLICVTSVTGSSDACLIMSAVTGKPYFGSSFGSSECPPGADCMKPMPAPVPGFGVDDSGGIAEVDTAIGVTVAGLVADGACPPNARCVGKPAFDVGPAPVQQTLTGFPRDTFWPQSAMAFLVVAVVLTLLSARMVMPSRRSSRLRRLRRRPKATP